jgi:hypothetical protein
MALGYEEFDLSAVKTYPLSSRTSKARVEDFARPHRKGAPFSDFLAGLPGILAASDLSAVVSAVTSARRAGAGIVWGLGAHVVKTGLSPVIVDLMERGFVTAVATNGAGIIHDFEVALSGATSEDVEQALGPGRFGMAEETGTLLNRAITEGVSSGLGIGQAVGSYLCKTEPPHASVSVAAAAWRIGIPLTVHVAIGTDVIHMHPEASGRALGEGSLRDFRYFVSNVSRLAGGVYLNCGSAVSASRGLPEGRGAGPKQGYITRGDCHRQPRLCAAVPAPGECRLPSDGRHRKRVLARRAPRAHDSSACGGAGRSRLSRLTCHGLTFTDVVKLPVYCRCSSAG